MAGQEGWATIEEQESGVSEQSLYSRSGFRPGTGIYNSLLQLSENHRVSIPFDDYNITTVVLSQFPHPDHAESRVALIDSATSSRVTYAQLRRSINSLAASLYHAIGIRKGDVVFLLSPNSILYPTICLAVLSIGAVLTTSNPLNTESEIAKQVHDSGAKLAISSPEELHKLVPAGVPTLITTRSSDDQNLVSIEELIEGSEPLDAPKIKCSPSDTAALLYSSGTTGVSKGVILTHSNFISIINLLKWTADATSSQKDIYLSFIPMFHIYGLALFGLGLFSLRNTIVLMPKFDFQAMLEAIETHKVNNITAVPPVILGLVKNSGKGRHDLSSLRRVSSGAAPLSKEIEEKFREKYPWIELRQGYGLTECCGATSFFVLDEQSKARPGSVGQLLPGISAKVIDVETGLPLPPCKEGELWFRSNTVMKGYLGNDEATAATIDREGWLKTGDLGYFDVDGFLYIVDRIKELIKHNGYQVAPAELEAILVSHPHILDAAVIPVEDEEAGQIPMAYVVRAADSGLTEDQVIQFIAGQVSPYKKVRKVAFIDSIPRSAAGKILRKELVVMQSKQVLFSKL
ncbi:AMP-dependent synthetase/ligase [Macleaya cordata]|uniref:AMP-dependent synthetase/ligase n=1 Tax=Macleaya cordata TaxID=56857 RepID=A0A200R5F1_MACCD|nr:AMP-dependent synthetase/ligase [Macleaya cordata]